MPLTQQTQSELEALARSMLSNGTDAAQYENFGTLVKMGTPEFDKRKDVIVFGEIEVDGIKFVYFA